MNYFDLIKNHKFLFFAVVFSFLVAVFSCVYAISNIKPANIIYNLIFFIPFLFVCLISFAACNTFKKHSMITKISSFVLNILIIGFFQIGTIIFMFMLANLFPEQDPSYQSPNNYKIALNTVWAQKCIEHFPKQIPENAKNVEFYKTNNNWFGSEAVTLKFEIDKKYIDKELKKYKFQYVENPDKLDMNEYNSHRPDAMMTDNNRIKTENFIFYIINDRESEIPHQNGFPYHYGIAVNDKLNQIIYYYTCPD